MTIANVQIERSQLSHLNRSGSLLPSIQAMTIVHYQATDRRLIG